MKIFKEHDKMKSHYEAVMRMRKRYIKLFIFISIILSIFSIYYFVKNMALFGLFFLMFIILLMFASIMLIYYNIYLPKKKPVFNEIMEDLNNKKIYSELSKKGLAKENIDVIIDPHGFIKIGYNYDNNTFYLAEISVKFYSFSPRIKEKVLQIDVNIFNKYIKNKDYKKSNYKKIGLKSKDELYSLYAEYIKNSTEIVQLANKCNEAVKENKKYFG